MSGFGQQGGFGQSQFGGSPPFNGSSFPGTPDSNWNANTVPHTPVPFAQPQMNQQQSHQMNSQQQQLFGTTAPQQPIVFGSAQSTTAIAASSTSNNPFAIAVSNNPFSNANTMMTPTPAFGGSSNNNNSNSNPFGGTATNAPIADNPFAPIPAIANQNPFGGPPAATTNQNPFGGTATGYPSPANPFASTSHSSSDPFPPASTQWTISASAPTTTGPNDRQNSRRKTPFGPPGTAAAAAGDSDDGMTDADDANTDHETKLAALKARLEKKKKKLEAKNQQKQQAPSLNPQGPPFQPTTAAVAMSDSDNPFTRYKGNDTEASEAPTRKHLPADLLQQADNPTLSSATTTTSIATKSRETLENASSLIGTCQTMCPDEEILRRERESDVQLLERIDHTSIHPNNWTLRDTMVKRFRRSAADFKLDVPEWVRPPDVLERVCSYLEEWIMERDRQGPDPRYEHNQNKTPLPLDVYQFIWDRTRMVRKDFTLQNYVGGKSGHCDARAVRCHERMARWHCLCEHQLSHISEFQSQQSQQNLQELGQTLKSLNQYYDDTMCRSLVEEADEHGNEQRSNATQHGCRESTIQGASPVDYDGTPLNPKASDNCFLGVASSPSHGTAEPEMRGLYILQTMMNEADGGLEITRFAFNLLQNRPEIYYSSPVQLALMIFKVSDNVVFLTREVVANDFQYRRRMPTITPNSFRS